MGMHARTVAVKHLCAETRDVQTLWKIHPQRICTANKDPTKSRVQCTTHTHSHTLPVCHCLCVATVKQPCPDEAAVLQKEQNMNYAGLSSHEGFSPFPCHISVFYYILTSLFLLFFFNSWSQNPLSLQDHVSLAPPPTQLCSPTRLHFCLLLHSLTHLDVTHNLLFQHLSTFFARSISIERVQNRGGEDGWCSTDRILISVWKKRSGSLTVCYLSRSSSFQTKAACDKRWADTRPWVLQCLWRRWSASVFYACKLYQCKFLVRAVNTTNKEKT